MKKKETGTKTSWNDYGKITIATEEEVKSTLDRIAFNKMQQGDKMTSSETSNAIHQLFSRLCLLEAKVRGDYTGEIPPEEDDEAEPDKA
jgi:hypothetical protein